MRVPTFHRLTVSRDRLGDWRGWLPGAVTLLLVALLAVQVVRLALVFFAPMTSATAPADVQASVAPALPTTDLFYRRAATAASSNSALGYTLYGVRSDMAGGSAILAGQDGLQQSWPIGSEIAPGLVLRSIGPDHATLESGGANHRLELAALAGIVTPATVPPAVAAAPDTAPAQMPSAPIDTPAPAANTPSNATASATGIRVGDTGHAALLHGIGLEAGDELLSVNGKPLTPLRLLRLRDELKGQPELAIEYRRDGRIRTTTFKLPQ